MIGETWAEKFVFWTMIALVVIGAGMTIYNIFGGK